MELLQGGELLEQLRQHQSFTEAQASHLFSQLVSVVHYMHSKRVVHRDLKPEVTLTNNPISNNYLILLYCRIFSFHLKILIIQL